MNKIEEKFIELQEKGFRINGGTYDVCSAILTKMTEEERKQLFQMFYEVDKKKSSEIFNYNNIIFDFFDKVDGKQPGSLINTYIMCNELTLIELFLSFDYKLNKINYSKIGKAFKHYNENRQPDILEKIMESLSSYPESFRKALIINDIVERVGFGNKSNTSIYNNFLYEKHILKGLVFTDQEASLFLDSEKIPLFLVNNILKNKNDIFVSKEHRNHFLCSAVILNNTESHPESIKILSDILLELSEYSPKMLENIASSYEYNGNIQDALILTKVSKEKSILQKEFNIGNESEKLKSKLRI